MKPEDIASTSAPAASATTPKALLTEEEKGKMYPYSRFIIWIKVEYPIAAEIAAKKSRLKQKLVKSARSVAIFSLKLKERRAREAERIAQETADVSVPTFCHFRITFLTLFSQSLSKIGPNSTRWLWWTRCHSHWKVTTSEWRHECTESTRLRNIKTQKINQFITHFKQDFINLLLFISCYWSAQVFRNQFFAKIR